MDCACCALDRSVAQLEPPVVELGSMRERRMVKPTWPAPTPNRLLACRGAESADRLVGGVEVDGVSGLRASYRRSQQKNGRGNA